ncbi:(Fe-S)-binding protein [Deferrisoma camini]|uniref:(Fe-S)-binding protein n=1 Tax=Deferrisoma camini TaxID=1035120 RepID=UPI00046CB479|nr:(Fe-S)-binding protein [Deferrisoma camini]
MENVADYKEIAELIEGAGGEAFRRCFQCGMCDVVCPWNRVRRFSMRKIVRQAAFGMTEIENEEIWRCTTCGRCPQRCPRDVRQIDSGMALRRIATEYGVFPENVRPVRGVSGNLSTQGNPFGEPREARGAWAEALGVRPFSEEMEILYFAGCYFSYDSRLKKVAAATAEILQRAGVEFGILGEAESCCGESIRKAGDEEAFKKLARQNIKAFIDRGVRRVLVSSPHCYHTFKNEYPEFMVHFEVVHMSQFLLDLIERGRLELTREVPLKVTFHDPCYLGRHNGLYDEPREVLRRVPGVELVEMADNREDSLCCGGGGGRIWMDTPKGERFSDLRVAQALDAGARVLATSCPYCISNFEDSRLALKGDDALRVMDLTEIVREAL